jgi:hypothetical protein
MVVVELMEVMVVYSYYTLKATQDTQVVLVVTEEQSTTQDTSTYSKPKLTSTKLETVKRRNEGTELTENLLIRGGAGVAEVKASRR